MVCGLSPVPFMRKTGTVYAQDRYRLCAIFQEGGTVYAQADEVIHSPKNERCFCKDCGKKKE